MKLILFVHEDALAKGAIFKRAIYQNFEENNIQIFQTFDLFRAKLKQIAVFNREIYVLLADSGNRLKELKRLTDLLEDKSIVLILPDDSRKTVSMAQQFYPRFFTYINNNYNDLCAVLNKMTNRKKIINKE